MYLIRILVSYLHKNVLLYYIIFRVNIIITSIRINHLLVRHVSNCINHLQVIVNISLRVIDKLLLQLLFTQYNEIKHCCANKQPIFLLNTPSYTKIRCKQ